MKNHLSILVLLLTATFSLNATIRTVSNDFNSPGQYNNLPAAVTAASNGDTIYVHGTSFNYGNITLNKRLVIIGPGHFPQKQNSLPASVGNFTLVTGSSNSKIIGINVISSITTGNDNIDTVSIINCKIGYRVYAANYYCDNWLMDGCVFIGIGTNVEGSHYQNGMTVRNCVLNGTIVNFTTTNGYHYCINNIFLYNGNVFGAAYYWYVNNCIFYRANTTQNGWQQFSNCLVYLPQNGTTTFPNGTGHINANPQFVNFPAAGSYFDYSQNYNLQAGSPAIAAGNDGTDMGVYGGLGDYNHYGIPRIPYISEITISNPSVAPGGTLNVTFKSKVRN